MNKKSVIVPEGSFRSKLTTIASALFAGAALAGIISILSAFADLSRFHETAAPALIKTLLVALHGWLTDAPVEKQVNMTFAILLGISILLGTLFSAALAVGIFQMQRGKAASGAQLIARGAKILFYATTVIGIGAAPLFAIRFVTYVMMYLSAGSKGLIFMLTGVATELVLGVFATLIILKLRRFFDSVGDCALSVSRTLTTGVLRAPTISMTPAIGALLLGIVSVLIALNCAGVITAAMFFCGGAAGVLMYLYLRTYKRSCEYLLYKGTPVTAEE